MDQLSDYTLVIDDALDGMTDAFVNDLKKEITVSPAVFSLLQDSDSRAGTLEQICGLELNLVGSDTIAAY